MLFDVLLKFKSNLKYYTTLVLSSYLQFTVCVLLHTFAIFTQKYLCSNFTAVDHYANPKTEIRCYISEIQIVEVQILKQKKNKQLEIKQKLLLCHQQLVCLQLISSVKKWQLFLLKKILKNFHYKFRLSIKVQNLFFKTMTFDYRMSFSPKVEILL